MSRRAGTGRRRPDLTPAFRPGLGQVRTFAIEGGAQFRVDPPPALRSARYTRDYKEVKNIGELHSGHRPPDRASVARFYAGPGAVLQLVLHRRRDAPDRGRLPHPRPRSSQGSAMTLMLDQGWEKVADRIHTWTRETASLAATDRR